MFPSAASPRRGYGHLTVAGYSSVWMRRSAFFMFSITERKMNKNCKNILKVHLYN